MITDIVERLIDNSLTLGILGIGLFFMWKENSTYRKKQDTDLEKVKEELHSYFTSDMSMLKDIVVSNTEAMMSTKEAVQELKDCALDTNKILRCLVPEVSEFKKSELYKEYKKQKSA
jgi:predicted glycosyltransferase involved in capsule biosynthesis